MVLSAALPQSSDRSARCSQRSAQRFSVLPSGLCDSLSFNWLCTGGTIYISVFCPPSLSTRIAIDLGVERDSRCSALPQSSDQHSYRSARYSVSPCRLSRSCGASSFDWLCTTAITLRGFLARSTQTAGWRKSCCAPLGGRITQKLSFHGYPKSMFWRKFLPKASRSTAVRSQCGCNTSSGIDSLVIHSVDCRLCVI